MSSDSEDDFYGNITERLQKEKDKFIEEKTDTLDLLDDSGELDQILKNNKTPPKQSRKRGLKTAEYTPSCSTSDLPEATVSTLDCLDDSGELDQILKNNKTPPKQSRKRGRKTTEDTPTCSTSDLPQVTVGSPSKSPPKRLTRARAKSTGAVVATVSKTQPPKAKSRKKAPKSTPEVSQGSEDSENGSGSIFGDLVSPRGGRSHGRGSRGGRARGRSRATPRRRNRNRRGWFWGRRTTDFEELLSLMFPTRSRPVQSWDASIPTYSVGNTDEYEDQSYNQPLFSNTNKDKPKSDDVVVVEEENLDDNEEVSVKVYWQSFEFFKFTIRRFQKLTQIFDYFANKENVSHDKLLFMYNDKIISPDDTPDSIDYSFVKFIDGGIVSQSVIDLIRKDKESVTDGIKLKFQVQNMKKPIEVTVREDDKLSIAMMKCSELLEKPLDKLKFEFDGDSISGSSTARDLEFEGGEIIDVKIVS